MIRHIIFFDMKEEATLEEIEGAIDAFRALKQEMPIIRTFSFGKNNSQGPRRPRYNWAMVLDFDNFEDLATYNKSEGHDRVVRDHLVKIVAHITGIDYDLEAYKG